MTDQKPEDVLAALDFPVTDVVQDGPVDMTATLVRRSAWDTMPCSLVPDLLTALGLTHGTPESMDTDHRESHQRMAAVFPLEGQIQGFAHVLGTVLTKAMAIVQGVDLCGEHEVGFTQQNTELIAAATRAVLAQLMSAGIIAYGPMAGAVSVQVVAVESDLEEDPGE